MHKSLEKALIGYKETEKVAFGESQVSRAFLKAIDKNPLLTVGAIGGSAGILGSLSGKAFDIAKSPVDTQSYKADKALNPGLMGALTRVKADELFAKGLTDNTTKIVNEVINSGIGDIAKSYKRLVHAPAQKAVLQDLMAHDEMIRESDPDHVASLFNTMVDVAPKMTKYKDAVKSFLRQGLAHEGGLDPVTIGELAKAEARLSGKNLKE
jgi:hypothetical protein